MWDFLLSIFYFPLHLQYEKSVGIAPTKAFAKVANRIAKKYPSQTGGCYVMDTEEKRVKALRWLPVEDVWGIGRRNAVKLQAAGAFKAVDFAEMPESWVRKNMTITGVNLQRELNGIRCIEFIEEEKSKSFAVSGLKKIYEKGHRYKRAGIALYNFTDEKQHQPSLFPEMNTNPRHKGLMNAIDAINHFSPSGGIRLASQDARMFKMHQEHLSKRYTTDIRDILQVRC